MIKLIDIINIKNSLGESFDDDILNQIPVVPLSDIPTSAAKASIGNGGNDDVVKSRKITLPAIRFRPAQRELIVKKAVSIAINMILSDTIGGELGSVVSNDKNPYIMDGHHRWAATILCDPKATITSIQFDLPGIQLVSVLNAITVGEFNRNGNDGFGNIRDFNSKNVGIVLNDLLENGTGDKYPKTPEEVEFALTKLGNGSPLNGIDIMTSNADLLPKNIMRDAPLRIDMPVIKDDEVDSVAHKFSIGHYDLTAPYSDEVKRELGLL